MTIDEAIKKGIFKLRLEIWAAPEDHIELYDAGDGRIGPWVKFYSPLNEPVGNDNPVTLPVWEMEREKDWVEYKAADVGSEAEKSSEQVTKTSASTKPTNGSEL